MTLFLLYIKEEVFTPTSYLGLLNFSEQKKQETKVLSH